MIIRITFKEKVGLERGEFTMMFGDSYKKWQTQFCEFAFNYFKADPSRGWRAEDVIPQLIKAEKCKDKWIGWGGLKWCISDIFQKELNREGCQSGDPDNPNPRQYSQMVFEPMPLTVIEKVLNDY